MGSKYPQNAFAAGAPPRTSLEELTALPRPPIAGFRGRFAAGEGGKGNGGKKGGERKGREWRERGREGV